MVKSLLGRRAIGVVTSLMAAAALGTVVGITSIAINPQAAFAGNPGGKITVATVMARAKWWMNTYGVVYSQAQYDQKPDGSGEVYRPDCSGFVSMAWHLPKVDGYNDRWTGDLNKYGDTTNLASLDNLSQGDAVLSSTHVMLFDRWDNASTKTEMWVYEEYNYGQEGRYAKRAKPSSGFTGVHYNKIVSQNEASPTVWCEYKVTASSGVNQRSNPGLSFTVEGNYPLNAVFLGAQNGTVDADGYTWRLLALGRLSNARLWAYTGGVVRTSTPCLT
jgi:hypothetical protein